MEYETLLQILDRNGIEYTRESCRSKMACPFHDEKTPSFYIFDNNSCYCFGCQKFCWYDQLVSKLLNVGTVEAKKMLGTYDPDATYTKSAHDKIKTYEFSDEPKDFSKYYLKLSDVIPPEMQQFMEGKKLDKIAIEAGGWRWCPKHTFKCWDNMEGICIPYFDANGNVCTFRLRRYDRMRQKFGHPIAPKGVSLQPSYFVFDKTKPVYFAEGESDTMSLVACGKNAICLPGVGAHKQLHSAIMQCLEWGVTDLIFCGDNDEAGQKFNEYALEAGHALAMGIYKIRMKIFNLPIEYNMLSDGTYKRKDINDFWVEGRLAEVLDPKPLVRQSTGEAGVQNLLSVFGDMQEFKLTENIF